MNDDPRIEAAVKAIDQVNVHHADRSSLSGMRKIVEFLTQNVVDDIARAALTAADAAAWRDISTAPKDRDQVIVMTPDGLDICWWTDGEQDGPDSMGHDPGWWGLRSAAPGKSFGNPDYFHDAVCQPTHWIDIAEPTYPEPPK